MHYSTFVRGGVFSLSTLGRGGVSVIAHRVYCFVVLVYLRTCVVLGRSVVLYTYTYSTNVSTVVRDDSVVSLLSPLTRYLRNALQL